jgi:Trk K+ transport system NAD-binding subunit
VLKRAGAATADGFIAVTNGDNRNIMAALIAQRMFKIKKIVARIYDPPRGQMYRELGVQTVCPTTVGAKLIRDVLIDAPWENQPFDFGKLTSVAALVGPGDAGKRVAEIEEEGRIRISAVRRGAQTVAVASSNFVLQEGDEVNAVVAPDAIGDFAQRFRSMPLQPKVTA